MSVKQPRSARKASPAIVTRGSDRMTLVFIDRGRAL
jgi:hypothetical protein